METTEIVLGAIIMVLVMFGYVKYQDLKRDLLDLEKDLWTKAGEDSVARVSMRVLKLEEKKK